MRADATCRASATSTCCSRSWSGLGATVEGRGTSHAAGHVRARHERPARSRCWSASCADPCCCSGRCSRGPVGAARASRAETSRRGARSHAPAGARGDGRRRSSTKPGHALDAPNGLTGASFYLDEASVTGTETALLAAAAATGRTEIRHAAMEPHVVELCRFLRAMGVGDRRRGHVDDPRRSAGALRRARSIVSTATTSRPAAGASSRRSPAATSRSPARAPRTSKSSPRRCRRWGCGATTTTIGWSSSRRR